MMRTLLGEEVVKSFPHLRRCAKPCDLPPHMKTAFMNESLQSKQVHVGKSQWIYIILGKESDVVERVSKEEFVQAMATVEGMEEIGDEMLMYPKGCIHLNRLF